MHGARLHPYPVPATLRLLVEAPRPAAPGAAAPAALLEQRVALTRFLLDRADEALRPERGRSWERRGAPAATSRER